MSQHAKKHRPPEFVTRTQNRRASGAAGPHGDRRDRRVRQRSAATRAAVARSTREAM